MTLDDGQKIERRAMLERGSQEGTQRFYFEEVSYGKQRLTVILDPMGKLGERRTDDNILIREFEVL